MLGGQHGQECQVQRWWWPADFERVLVEEGAAVARQAGHGTVVEREFHRVGVAAVGAAAEHPGGPEDEADGGAGLGVGGLVGEVVVLGEAFVGGSRADAAGDVHLLGGEVVPEDFEGGRQGVVIVLGGDVGHAGIEVHGADGVADDAGLFADGQVGLIVLVALLDEGCGIAAVADRFFGEVVGLLAALVDEELREIEVTAFARDAGQLDEGELDFLVAAVAAALAFAGAEDGVDVVGIAAHDVEELALSGGLEIGDGALDQVAGAIELVVIAEVGPAAAGLDALEPGVEVAVVVLHLRRTCR